MVGSGGGLGENPAEVEERVGSVVANLLDDGMDDSTAPAGIGSANEHPVLVAKFGGANSIFGEVVLKLDFAVSEAGLQV